MFTRKQKALELKRIASLCTSFSIDVQIRYPEVEKLKEIELALEIEKTKREILENSIKRRITKQIHQKIQSYHPYGDVEVMIEGVPYYFWREISKVWESYQPKRKKQNGEKKQSISADLS
jgi:uncharacterized membrane protein